MTFKYQIIKLKMSGYTSLGFFLATLALVGGLPNVQHYWEETPKDGSKEESNDWNIAPDADNIKNGFYSNNHSDPEDNLFYHSSNSSSKKFINLGVMHYELDLESNPELQKITNEEENVETPNPDNHRTAVLLPRKHYCSYNNKSYEAGERFQPDSCTFCHCPRHNNRVQCSIQDCKYQANCVRYNKTSDLDCCGHCVEVGCKHVDEQIYRPMDIVVNTKCKKCFCPDGGGKIQCTQARCPPVNCVNPVKKPGHCCHRCPNGPNCWLGSFILPGGGKVYQVTQCKICQCPSYPLPFWMKGRKLQALCSNTCNLDN